MDEFKRKYLLLLTPVIAVIFLAYMASIAPKGTTRSVIQENCKGARQMNKPLAELADAMDAAEVVYWTDVKAKALDEVLVRIKTLKAELAEAETKAKYWTKHLDAVDKRSKALKAQDND